MATIKTTPGQEIWFERIKQTVSPCFLIATDPEGNFVEGKKLCFQDYETLESFWEALAEAHRVLEAEYPSPDYSIMTIGAENMYAAAKAAKTHP